LKNKLQSQKLILTLTLFLAGVSFLVYEVVWDRMLSLYLGVTVYASTIVVSAYMAGLALGAYYIGKKAGRSNNPSSFLALLLLLVGVTNTGVYFLLRLLPGIAGVWQSYTFSLASVFISAFMIGGIMPAVSRIYKNLGSSSSQSIGNTFAADTIGSTAGGILAGFFLLGSVGMKGSVLLMSALNIFLAVMILLTIGKVTAKQDNQRTDRVSARNVSRFSGRTVMLITFITGLTGLSAQILWMRIFRIYLTNTSYTFSLIVSVVIFGYFIGSMIFKKYYSKERDGSKVLLISLFSYGAVYIWGVMIFLNAPELLIIPLHETLTDPALRIMLPPVILSLLTVLPQSILSGFIFTSAVEVYKDSTKSISERFGSVYFFNTAGAFIGPFLAAFVLIPNAGVVRSLMIVSLLSTAVSAYIGFKNKIWSGSFRLFSIIFSISVAAALFLPQIKIMPPSFSMTEREILFYRETVEATLVVGQEKDTGLKYTYFNNNSVIGSSYDAVKAVKLLGHLPFLVSKVPEKALIVGFGIGVTTSTVLQHPEVRSVICVELAEELKEAAVLYSDLNNDVVNDPRLKIIGNDGRHFLQNSNEKYDLISSDPTHPVLGSGNLYSEEYFQLCYDHLTDEGMVTQYLPMHKLLFEDYAGIIKTFNTVFENTTVWLGHTHTILVGTIKPLKIDFADFSSKASQIKDQYLYNDPYSLASFLILDSSSVAKMTGGAAVCHDDKSYLDFFKFDSFLPENWSINAQKLLEYIAPSGIIYNIGDQQKYERFCISTKLVLQGLIRSMSGDLRGYLSKLYEAYQITPENQEISFLIRLENLKSGN